MKIIFPLVLTISVLIGCKNRNANEGSGNVPNDPTEKLNVQIENFSEIDTSGIFMFPLRMGETKGRIDSYEYKDMPYNSYWNIIFYNSKTKEQHLLSDKKMLIESFITNHESDSERNLNWAKNYIFYNIKIQDINKDSLLNENDPVYLFVSDKSGENFRQISPSHYDVHRWEMTNSELIILSASKDSNSNNKFDGEDEISIFEIDLKSTEAPKEIFSEAFKKELKVLYGRDWKRIK